MRRSPSSICTSTSSASGSTATVTVEVWMRPWLSVVGTRCTRCTPDSYFSRANTLRPVISAMPSFSPPSSVSSYSRISKRQPRSFGVFLVHGEQLGGEQRRLVAAGRRAHFQDGGALVGLVLRQQRQADFVLQRRGSGPSGRRSSASASSRISGIGQQRTRLRPGRARRRAGRRCGRPAARFRRVPSTP